MEVRIINSKEETEAFIFEVAPHTFLGSWNWGEFEIKMNHKVWRLGVYEGNTLIALATMTKTVARRGTFLIWHHGPIIKPSSAASSKEIISVLKNFSLDIAKKEGCHFLRVSPVLSDSPENRAIFKELGFRDAPIHLHSELGWLLDITPAEDILLSKMRKNTRYAIRKAEKDGIKVVKSEDIKDFDAFWTIYIETALRQKFTPYSKDYVRNEFEVFLKGGQAVLFFGEYQGTYISTAFVIYTQNSGFYHHGASTHNFPGISASELVQWEAIREGKNRGCTTYNFWGVVPETATQHPWYGLSKFKRGFGGYEDAHVHAQDLVIHPKYWLNYLVEKVRKIKRRV